MVSRFPFFEEERKPRIEFFEEKQKPRNQTITTRIVYKKGLDRCSFLIPSSLQPCR